MFVSMSILAVTSMLLSAKALPLPDFTITRCGQVISTINGVNIDRCLCSDAIEQYPESDPDIFIVCELLGRETIAAAILEAINSSSSCMIEELDGGVDGGEILGEVEGGFGGGFNGNTGIAGVLIRPLLATLDDTVSSIGDAVDEEFGLSSEATSDFEGNGNVDVSDLSAIPIAPEVPDFSDLPFILLPAPSFPAPPPAIPIPIPFPFPEFPDVPTPPTLPELPVLPDVPIDEFPDVLEIPTPDVLEGPTLGASLLPFPELPSTTNPDILALSLIPPIPATPSLPNIPIAPSIPPLPESPAPALEGPVLPLSPENPAIPSIPRPMAPGLSVLTGSS